MRRVRVTLVVLLATILPFAGISAASAFGHPQPHLVAERAVDWTPSIQDGAVRAIVQVGNTLVVGGTFTTVTPAAGGASQRRPYLLAFNATTGALSQTFQPTLDGTVNALVAAPDGRSIYVGGEFNFVNGARAKSITRLNLDDGSQVAGFSKVVINGVVSDLRLSAGRLWMGGNFSKVAGADRPAVVTVDATTGAVDPFFALDVSGTQNGGRTSLTKFDITPDGARMLAIGNFATVGGQTRRQVVMLDLTGASATLADWSTTFYSAVCASAFDSYMRDLDISPDGKYAVLSTTGAYRGATSPCDTTARFEIGATGTSVQPTWINSTGGDTTYAVAITGTVVYVGGHFRWQNNAYAGDRAGQGAVAREGIAALDPASGLPLDWNPGRARGVGVFDLLATDAGLWVGSDTDRLGGWGTHPKIGFLPLAGGAQVPASSTLALPGRVAMAGSVPGQSADAAFSRTFSGTAATALTGMADGGILWSGARGAVMISGKLYTGWSDGLLYSRTFDGQTFGAPVAVAGMDQLVSLSSFHTEVPNITAMFFDQGRLYYSLSGSSSLYYRSFSPASGVVGAVRYTAANTSALTFSNVSSLMLSDGRLYVGERTLRTLRAVSFAGGAVSGTVSTVSGPSVDGQSWSARAVFIAPGAPNNPPVAGFTATCTQLACTFDGSASTDHDGMIASYAWDFGDGSTATGPNPQHTYADAGERTITLTVTDNRGATGSSQQQVGVHQVAATIGFVGAAATNAQAVSVAVTTPSGVRDGDGLVLVATGANDGVALTAPAGWDLVKTVTSPGLRTEVWQQVAGMDAAGATVKVTAEARIKLNVTLAAYRGTSTSGPIASISSAIESTQRAAHSTPTSTATVSGSWVLSYWADNTATTTAWNAPTGQSVRAAEFGAGGGHVSSLLTDSDGAAPLGTVGDLTATASSAAAKAHLLTVLLVPAT